MHNGGNRSGFHSSARQEGGEEGSQLFCPFPWLVDLCQSISHKKTRKINLNVRENSHTSFSQLLLTIITSWILEGHVNTI